LANRKGFSHIAFFVEDVAATRERVLKYGGRDIGEITQTEAPGVGKLTFIYMADPEGNILEIQHWS
jgi:predicted enzyme related to lactoylglutathione lyase